MHSCSQYSRHILVSTVFLLLTGCAAMKSQYDLDREGFFRDANQYEQSARDKSGNLTAPENLYFSELLGLATKYKQATAEKLFRMMRLEYDKKHQGYANEYDHLKARYDASDPTLGSYAETYEYSQLAQNKCASFGYKAGSAEFNKCVYEVKVQIVQLMMQQQSLLQQQRPVTVWTPPAPQRSINIQTQCTNTYAGVQCQTTGN